MLINATDAAKKLTDAKTKMNALVGKPLPSSIINQLKIVITGIQP
jgi:hypothetical protein